MDPRLVANAPPDLLRGRQRPPGPQGALPGDPFFPHATPQRPTIHYAWSDENFQYGRPIPPDFQQVFADLASFKNKLLI